ARHLSLSSRLSTTRYPFSSSPISSSFLFFNDPATTEISTLSLHDALPICGQAELGANLLQPSHQKRALVHPLLDRAKRVLDGLRSEEHTSELQSLTNLVCRLLLEKKKNIAYSDVTYHHNHEAYLDNQRIGV